MKIIPTFEEFLTEQLGNLPEEQTIQELNKLIKTQDRVWVLVGGTLAAGKSYIVRKHLDIESIDMDDYVEKLSGGKGKYDSKLGMKARILARKQVDSNFAKGKTFLKQGVSANFRPVENQCLQAKDAGYTCVFLYVDTPIKQAIKNNKKRVDSGEREASVPDYKIIKKYKDSMEVFKTLKKTPGLFDFYVHYKT